MTRAHDIVRLSPGNWIALFSLVLAIVLALVAGVAQVADVVAELRTEVRFLNRSLTGLEARLERLEALRPDRP